MSFCFKGGRAKQIFAGFTGGLCLLLAGGWAGWASPFLHKLKTGGEFTYDMTSSQVSWVVSLSELMPVIVSIPGGYIQERVGRKTMFLITALFYEISALFAAFSTNVNYLYVSRAASGIGMAFAYMAVPLYLGEIAETKIRGAVSALFTVLLWGGLLLVNVIALFNTLKTVEIILAIIPLIFFVLVIFILPESPYYHLMKDNQIEAHKCLKQLRNEKDEKESPNELEIKQEMEEMHAQVKKEMECPSRWTDLVSTKATRRATWIVLVISAMQRFSGINVMLSYMVTQLPSTGGGVTPDIFMIIFGLLLMMTGFFSMFVIDTFGRKPVLYASGIICAILQGMIAFFYYSRNLPDYDITHLEWIPYACMIAFAFFYQGGIGTIAHTLLGEMFPANVKSKAAAVTNIVFSTSTFIILKAFTVVTETYGVEAMFLTFAISSALSAVFTYFFVIETKGKTLAEIQEILSR